MFSPKIVASDAFLDMPTSSRELYFQLGMYADDDGFINPRKIIRMVGASEDDIKVLIAKRFLIPFENGVVVIKHWAINNLIRKDWHQETLYTEQKKMLVKKENGAYTEALKLGNELLTTRQHSIVKNSIVKNTTEQSSESPDKKIETPFILKEEIKKLEDSARRDFNIIALYFDERKPKFENHAQYQVALHRHLRDAATLKPFTDEQILTATKKAKREYPEWTLGTLVKLLTK